ncbi:MAG: LPXTG cell wall anchor domain-containing protein [Methylococcaceae bacterium]|nr:LPXTG cell wall anchor domain-containing protein [Methylococcaceae bacterium]
MRNLTKTIAAVSLLAPASAYPLGIGDIKLHSALNQNLDAEIALLVSAGENVSGLNIRLAPPEKFDEAGVPWSYFLSKIKFTSVVRADGSTVIKLSSKEALREPFLDFLLEVSWDKGNLYREFTVLVDPPAAYTQPVIPVVKKATQVTGVKESVVKVNSRTNTTGIAKKQYYSTSRTDTLWKIADKTNVYNDVSIEQMMMAIYEANPRAFYKQNVNALKADHRLDIPEKEIILKLSRNQALAAFKQQENVWQGRVVEKNQVKKNVSDNTKINTQLELEAPAETEIPESVVVSENGASGDSPVDSDTKTSGFESSEKSLALQAKMQELEKQVMMMKKMLVLKDEQISALQNQQKVGVVPIKQIASIDQKDKTVKTSVKTTQADVAKPTVTTKPKEVEKPKPLVQPEPETGFWSDSFTTTIGGIGLAILGILGLFWWRKRKVEEELESESMFASASEISLPDNSEDKLSVPVMDDSSSYDVGTVGESSFLSEFTPSDFDAFDTDQNEVDPISEADVYLAYGRYQQAEDLMHQAIADQPERDECKLKLLEIFYANENKSAFEEYATELVTSGKHNDQEFWTKVVDMGSELDPSCPLYTDKAGEKASFETTDSGENSTAVIVSNSDENTADSEEVIDQPEDKAIDNDELVDENGNIVEFDLSVFDEDESSTSVREKTDDGSLDFDLSVFDLDDSSTGQTELSEANSEEIESVDFDLPPDVESNEEHVGEIDLTAEVDTDESLETFDFSSDSPLSDVVETDLTRSETSEKETESFDEFEFDFDLDLDLDTPTSTSESLPEIDEGVSDLTDMDELETKIDLAKAYIDMGDIKAAKKIAEEVLKDGNSEQKQSAQTIIDQLK